MEERNEAAAGEAAETKNVGRESQADVPSLRGYIITWVLSVAAACVIGWAWMVKHPVTSQPRIAKVDLASVMEEEIRGLTANLKLDMSEQDKNGLQKKIEATGMRIDAALDTLSQECGCVIMTSAAIAKDKQSAIQDLTWRLKELLRN